MLRGKCIPEKREIGDKTPPNYICLPNGTKHYLSMEEKKDYLYGGECPVFCPIKSVQSNCPPMVGITDTSLARITCEANPECHFLGNQLFDRMGPNYCVPRTQPGCITLTESDLVQSDKVLTDGEQYCDRLNRGCIFDRGGGDTVTSRRGEPTCLRGCLGSKYWKNPKYMWGAGGTPKDPFRGSWYNSDLEMGPIYLEAAPSDSKPDGWGGPSGTPWNGNGRLPKSLGIPYTESRGKYSPPCNLNQGDVGAFTSAATGENLAGPGCRLTPPTPRFGIVDWSYTCRCPYLGNFGEFKTNAWEPCASWELDQEVIAKRDVCTGCYISNDKNSKMYGHCVLGKKTMDTESEKLGCVPDINDPHRCRIKRTIEPTECPAFCSSDRSTWNNATQCSKQLSSGCWKPNPAFDKIISLRTDEMGLRAKPYLSVRECDPLPTKEMNELCRNCAQTTIKEGGSSTRFPNYSFCVVGGNESGSEFQDTGYGNYLLRKLTCPSTCNQCMTGFFNEPLDSQYDLEEARNPSSVFSKGIIYTPAIL